MEDDLDLLGGSGIHSNASLILGSMICDRSGSADVTDKYGNFNGAIPMSSNLELDNMNPSSSPSCQKIDQNINQNYVAGSKDDFESTTLLTLTPPSSLASLPVLPHTSSRSPKGQDVPSTVIIVSCANLLPLSVASPMDSQIYNIITPVIDISSLSTLTSSSSPSSVSLSFPSFSTVCHTSPKSSPLHLSVPLLISPTSSSSLPSSSLLPSPLAPSSSPSSTSSSLSSLNSLVDLQPLSLMPCQQSPYPFEVSLSHSTSISSPVSSVLSSVSLRQSTLSTHKLIDGKDSSQSLSTFVSPQSLKSTTTYDFSPSKESPPKPLKSMRKRPPPPPVGSYKNQKNYFSKLKISNLRRVVLEKTLVGKSADGRKIVGIQTRKDAPKSDEKSDVKDLPKESLSHSAVLQSHLNSVLSVMERSDKFNSQLETSILDSTSLNRTSVSCAHNMNRTCKDPPLNVTGNLQHVTETDQSARYASESTAKETSLSSHRPQQDFHKGEPTTDNSISAMDSPSMNKRKRGRPRKNENLLPKAPRNLESKKDVSPGTLQTTPPKRSLNTIVTRHSVFRKSNDEASFGADGDDDSDKDFSPQPKRTHKRKAMPANNDPMSTRSAQKRKPSFESRLTDQQSKVSSLSGAGSGAWKKSDHPRKCAVVVQGGFKRSREFLKQYIQISPNEDILFPHITQEDVCLFKMANQFYKEHKDKSYDIFSQDEDSNEALQISMKQDEANKATTSLRLSILSESSEANHGNESRLVEGDGKPENKAETGEVVVKRGRGRPRINRDNKEMQALPESERKKKKLISSILRELGDQEDIRRTATCTQNISTIISGENDTEASPPERNKRSLAPAGSVSPLSTTDASREVRSFVTFVTPKKRQREESSSVESTPSKKVRMEERPSLFLSFGSEASSEKNFVTFESLISRSITTCASSSSSSLMITSRPPLVSIAQGTNKQLASNGSAEEKVENNSEGHSKTPLLIKTDSNRPEDSLQKELPDIRTKCSCKHVCGLQDTYLLPPFKRPPSQTSNPPPPRVDSRSSVLTLSYPPTPVPQPFVYPSPFPAPASFLPFDFLKHPIFQNASGDSLRDQQQPHVVSLLGENAIRLPTGNHAQPLAMLCRNDNLNPMISLVMAPNGYGYYAIPMAMDNKMQFPPVNQSPIFVPYVVNGLSAPQADGSKSTPSEREVSAETEMSTNPRSSPSPVQSSIPSSSAPHRQPPVDKVQETAASLIIANGNSGSVVNQQDNHANKSTSELSNSNGHNDGGSSNYNASILSSSSSYGGNEPPSDSSYHDSPSVGGQFNQTLLINREASTMYFSTNGNSFGSASNINVFSNNSGGRISHAYYDECTPSRYFHSARSHYDRSSDPYNNPRAMIGSLQVPHPQNRVNNLGGFAATPTMLHRHPSQGHAYNESLTPQFTYSSYNNSIAAPSGFGHHTPQSFFNSEVLPEQSKRVNAFGNHYRSDEHLQRLGGKTVQNGHNSSLWS